MIDDGVGRFTAAQRLAGVARLTAGLLAGAFAQAADAGWRLFQSIAGWRFATVGTVQPEVAFQFSDPRLQRHVLREELLNQRRLRQDHRFR